MHRHLKGEYFKKISNIRAATKKWDVLNKYIKYVNNILGKCYEVDSC